VNIAIMRAFIRLRQPLAGHGGRAAKVAELARRIESHAASRKTLVDAIRRLMAPSDKHWRSIVMRAEEAGLRYRERRSTEDGK
jgi:hypothetical protein